jgi:hypothetical protein
MLHDVADDHPVLDLAVALNQQSSASALFFEPARSALVAATTRLLPVDGEREHELACLRQAALLQAWEVVGRLPGLAQLQGVTLPPDERRSPGIGNSGHALETLLTEVRTCIEEPSRYRGAALRSLVDAHPDDFLIVNGDGERVVANVAYRSPDGDTLAELMAATTLAMFVTEARHPSYGSGLLVVLNIPTHLASGEIGTLSLGLNRAELLEHVPFSSYGAWCEHQSAPGELAHCQFWPSAFAAPGTLPMIATDLGFRSRWVAERLLARR